MPELANRPLANCARTWSRGWLVSVPVPAGYAEVLGSLKAEVRAAQLRAHRVVNTELLGRYWQI